MPCLRLHLWLSLVGLVTLIHVPCAAQSAVARLSDTTTLQLRVDAGIPLVSMQTRKAQSLQIDPSLRSVLTSARESYFVGQQPFKTAPGMFLLLVTETPSPKAGLSRCSAGTEDVVHLLEVLPQRLQIRRRDHLLIQSCAENLALSDDSGQTLRSRLEGKSTDSALVLQWLDHPKYGSTSRELAVVGTKLVVRWSVLN